MIDLTTDAELLDRFVERRDETAFAQLVHRHGPMVRATCRRALGDRCDVDDAFQAVFVVLARKAGAVRDQHLLGPWLHTVAVRTAQRARLDDRRRLAREHQVLVMAAQRPSRPRSDGAGHQPDWLVWLDEELQALPTALRDALVLCELEGLSRAEAAQRLRVAEGTLSSRLARAKVRLRERLVRRGAVVSVAGLAVMLVPPGDAVLAAVLVETTIQAALGGAASAPVAVLAQGVLKVMLLQKITWLTAVTAAAALTVGAAGTIGLYVFAAAAVQDAGGDGKSDHQKLQGAWEVRSAEMFGKAIEEEKVLNQKLVIEGDKMTMKHGGPFKLRADKKPKEFDMEISEGPANEQGTWRGIYELRGDDFTFALAMPGIDRPTAFKTEPGVRHLLMKLKRAK